MTSTRRLIIDADDFSLSDGINRGVDEAHDRGVVTNASLMVCWPDAPPAVASAKRWKGISFGLHVDLGQWTYRDSTWRPYHERVTRLVRTTKIRNGRFITESGHAITKTVTNVDAQTVVKTQTHTVTQRLDRMVTVTQTQTEAADTQIPPGHVRPATVTVTVTQTVTEAAATVTVTTSKGH
jgi:hypothetical protein